MRKGTSVVPPEVTQALERGEVKGAGVQLAVALGRHTNKETGKAWPGVRRLMSEAGIKHWSTFKKARRQLESFSGLKWEKEAEHPERDSFTYWYETEVTEGPDTPPAKIADTPVVGNADNMTAKNETPPPAKTTGETHNMNSPSNSPERERQSRPSLSELISLFCEKANWGKTNRKSVEDAMERLVKEFTGEEKALRDFIEKSVKPGMKPWQIRDKYCAAKQTTAPKVTAEVQANFRELLRRIQTGEVTALMRDGARWEIVKATDISIIAKDPRGCERAIVEQDIMRFTPETKSY